MKKDFLKKIYDESLEFGDITSSILKFCNKYDGYEINLECIDGEIYQDSDFDEFLNAIGYSVVSYIKNENLLNIHKELFNRLGCSDESDYLILSNKENMFLIPCRDEENRFDEDLPDETLYSFEDMVEIPKAEQYIFS